MRDVALLGINPGTCTALLDWGRGRLACAACLGNLSASALTILREAHQEKNITKKNKCDKWMAPRPSIIIIIINMAVAPPVNPEGP